MENIKYEVKVQQLIAFYDEAEDIALEFTGEELCYIAGSFDSEKMALLFKEALESKIAEEQGYVVNAFSPRCSIWKCEVERQEIK